MMATMQIRMDDTLKEEADALFSGLGLDTTTAVRIFLRASIERGGIPFPVAHSPLPRELRETIEDVRNGRNLYGPFETAEEAVASMLEDE